MIIFDLICQCGFEFEGWFKDHDEMNYQQQNGLLSCPNCSGNCVHKILSPVAYQKKTLTSNTCHSLTDENIFLSSFENTMRIVSDYVEKNYEDVGTEFTSKALKMYFGVEKAKNIRGVVSEVEEKLLNREGIDVVKFPYFKKPNEGKH